MRAVRLVPLLLAAAGCGKEFTPRSVVVDTRVLAIVAAPLEVGPSDSVTLTAWRVGPPGGAIASERWSFCPFSVGATAGYACAVPECEDGIPLPPPALATAYGPSNPLTASPGQLAQQCLALLSASGALPAGVPAQLPDRVEVLFRYRVTAAGSVAREAVQRIPLYLAGAPADPNVAPGIASVAIGAPTDVVWASGASTGLVPVLRSGETLDVEVLLAPGSAQTYVEGDRTLTEQLVVSFYTTAGRFDYDWANGPDAKVKLEGKDLAAGTAAATVWVVARDLRGGETVAGPIALSVVAP
ncbi:MAG TPA: hypothetical protein VF841_11155 [Anaeromyxobacter sp.]